MRIVATKKDTNYFRSGAYVGSIGAGGFEVRPDGKFYRCRIFNDWKPEINIDACFLYKKNENVVKTLSLHDLAVPARILAGVNKIIYEAEFPLLKISSPEFPLKAEFLSFFVPGDIKNSSLPSILIRVKGKGKCSFLFPMPSKSKSTIRNNTVFLKNETSEIGIFSCNSGKVFTVHQDMTDFWRTYRYKFSATKGILYAGVCWDGNFEDEIILSWYSQNMRDHENNFIGHYYTNHFKSCQDVLNYVRKNKEKLKSKSLAFHKSIYKKNVPNLLKDAYMAQVSSFVKQSWFAKNGKFGVWEGSCNCCGLQTTDVSFYGSWLYVNLFPELEKAGIKLTADFQRKDGWIPHYFPGTFKKIDEYGRKDMNMQFVLMIARDYILWKDKKFLKGIYPKVKKAIELVYSWDTDNDLIPDIEGPDQTFDAWKWKGCSIYLASLWLATLKTGEKLAKEVGDTEFSKKCKHDLRIVREITIKKLWNGKYFILWNAGKTKDYGCLLDALPGEWYSRLLGFGHILPAEMVKSHLRTCFKYNRKRVDLSYMKAYFTKGEQGWCYINGAYRRNKRYCFQQYEPWTGIEYTFALNLSLENMKEKALKVIKDISDRKIKCGMFFNHIECGGDYFRPMVIGALWDMLKK